MKKLILALMLVTFPILGRAEIIIEFDQAHQSSFQCDSLKIHYTLTNHDGSTYIIPVIKDSFGFVVMCDTFLISGLTDNYHGTITLPIPHGTFGSHSCVILAEDSVNAPATSNVEDIDLMLCNTDVGIEENEPAWCFAQILSESVLVRINNNYDAFVSIFDMHGRMVLPQKKISETQTIPLDLPVGVYSLIIEQPGNRTKIFKLTALE